MKRSVPYANHATMFSRKIGLGATILIAVLCAPLISKAQPDTLRPTGLVNDFADVIDAGTTSRLSQILTSFERSTGIEIAVVTTPSLNGIPVEDFATGLFEQWGIGKKGKDNGLLILVAPNERKTRIEVGYDLEGGINDAVAGRIIRDTMIPWFKNGDFSTGILNGAVGSISILNAKYDLGFDPSKVADLGGVSLKEVSYEEPSLFSNIFAIIIIIFLIFLFIKNPWAGLFFFTGTRVGRSWGVGSRFSGGGFGRGGGFGGFGGGMSGGGGASGGW